MFLPWLTSLDFDASPICHCVRRPNQIQRYPSFLTFVDSILQDHQSSSLTRFHLDLGVHPQCVEYPNLFLYGHKESCIPHLNSTQLNAWITFPLTRCGLRELDLRVYLRERPNQTQFPPQVFMIETLEILKLDANLSFDGISIFCLPNLKILHLTVLSIISDDTFLTSLVSSCPSLDELYVSAWWNHVRVTKILSPSLRRLSLLISKIEEARNSELVVLDTPNLEDLVYLDTVALQYSVTSMPGLVKASIVFDFGSIALNESCQHLLVLIGALSNVRQLGVDGEAIKALNYIGDYERLPVFRDLILLELSMSYEVERETLLAFLYRSPNLETLVFHGGLGGCSLDTLGPHDERRTLEMEEKARKLNLASIPCCCRFNLKRVLVYDYQENEETLLYIKFLLKYSLVLEELVVITNSPTAHESTLQNLPRASPTCSIKKMEFLPYGPCQQLY